MIEKEELEKILFCMASDISFLKQSGLARPGMDAYLCISQLDKNIKRLREDWPAIYKSPK